MRYFKRRNHIFFRVFITVSVVKNSNFLDMPAIA